MRLDIKRYIYVRRARGLPVQRGEKNISLGGLIESTKEQNPTTPSHGTYRTKNQTIKKSQSLWLIAFLVNLAKGKKKHRNPWKKQHSPCSVRRDLNSIGEQISLEKRYIGTGGDDPESVRDRTSRILAWPTATRDIYRSRGRRYRGIQASNTRYHTSSHVFRRAFA